MSRPAFNLVAALVFGAVALAHAVRIARGLPVLIGEMPVPMWVSWVGFIVPAALCVWGLRAYPQARR
jgi:hypothetical protein